MAEEFHIKFSSATRWEGEVHYFMGSPRERIDALLPILYSLIQSQADPSGDHICPVCGQIFEIDIYKVDLTEDPLVLSTFCKICNIHVFFRSNKIPVWAKEAPVKEWWEELRSSQKKNDSES